MEGDRISSRVEKYSELEPRIEVGNQARKEVRNKARKEVRNEAGNEAVKKMARKLVASLHIMSL